MSLLMEALRKAEEAKRRMQQEEQAAASKESAEAPRAPPSSDPAKTNLPFTLEERETEVTADYLLDNFSAPQDQELTAEPGAEQQIPEATPAPEPEYARQPAPEIDAGARNLARRKQRAAAASVFVAKQNPGRNRKTLTILVIVMVLMIPVGGGVLWYLQSATAPSIGFSPSIANYDLSTRALVDETQATANPETEVSPAVTVTEPDVAAVATDNPPAGSEATPNAAVADSAIDSTNTGERSTAVANEPPVVVTAETPQLPAAPLAAPADAPADASANPPVTAPAPVLEISRTRGARQVNPDLVTAYDRLQAGDLLLAGQSYQEVLNALPNNRDALLGLALVHLRQGELASARALYARALQLNPRDALAHTGLLQTMQVTNPAEHESALKALLAEYPDVAQLTLALGNLYAAQQRWSEAQAAYYNALLTASRSTDGPVNPDYAFNLAISLEQLNKPKVALDYYRQAQALAREVAPGFDPQLLNDRLAYLEQAQP